MDGMGGLDNAPMPPMDADPGMPMDGETPPPPPPAPETDPIAGGPDDDPLAGDPNALSAGDPNAAGEDISQKYQQLSPDQQKAADKYVDSMLNTESIDRIRRAIDETFSTILDDTQEGTERPQKELGSDVKGNLNNPYTPGI